MPIYILHLSIVILLIHNTMAFRNLVSQYVSVSGLMQLKGSRINDVLKNPQWPEKWPFFPEDFKREDESNDKFFYDQARLVTHIDDSAIAALTNYYSKTLRSDSSILDICSSWISHYPANIKFKRATGLGMNSYELSKNKQLTDYNVQDLNQNPKFPYADNTFDYVTCVVSVDYLTRPLEIFSEVKRVLKVRKCIEYRIKNLNY